MNGLRVTAFGMTQTLYATNQRFPEDSTDNAVDSKIILILIQMAVHIQEINKFQLSDARMHKSQKFLIDLFPIPEVLYE